MSQLLRHPAGRPRRPRRSLRPLAIAAAVAILACAAEQPPADGASPAAGAPASPPPAASQSAAEVPADAVLRDFEATGDYQLEIGGEVAENVEIFFSERVPAYLIMSSRLPAPALLLPRSGTVETVSVMSLARRADGRVDLLADAELTPGGRFQLDADGERIRFDLAGQAMALRPRPYLLGLQDLGTMLGYSPEYARTAASYTPDPAALTALRGQAKAVRVRVYFGSWCPYCKRYVPNMLKVAEQLAGSKVAFEFYGLPRPFDGEPQAEKDDVHSVPTGVVFVGGREAGRLETDDWRRPEASLARILNGG